MATEAQTTATYAHSIHHTNFPSTDLQRTEAWYGNVFGYKKIDISRFVGEPTTLLLSNGNFHMHFEKYPTVEVPLATGDHRPGEHLFHVAIEVEDWDPFLAHLKDLGIEPEGLKERPQDNSKSATLTDPDGHQVEIVWHGNRDW